MAPTLYDAFGRPVKPSELSQEVAMPSVGGVRSPFYESVANSLDPERMAEILANVDHGDHTEYLTLAEEMEERELHYHSVLGTRKLGVSALDIVVEAASDSAEDVKIAEALEGEVLDDAFSVLVDSALDGLGKGYSVTEIMWERTARKWYPREFKWRDPRFFVFDQETRTQIRLRDEGAPVDGAEMPPYKFVVHVPRLKMGLPIRGGLARLAAVAYMVKSYALKDWLAFVEVYGMPVRIGKFPGGSSNAQKSALLAALGAIGADAQAIIPKDMELEVLNASVGSGSSNDKIFSGLAKYLDSLVSKGVLGQTMSTDDGSSLAQAKVHDEVRKDIRNADARQLAATLRRDFVKPYVDLNFGPRSRGMYPKLRIDVEEPEDLKSLSESLVPFIDKGLRVEESEIRDKFKLSEPADDAYLLGGLKTDKQQEEADREAEERPDNAGELADNGAPPAPQDGEEPTDEQTPEQARRRAIVQLMQAVVRGDELTADQRALMQSADEGDAIEALVEDAADQWEPLIGSVVDPILAYAERSEDYDQFVAGLDAVIADVDATEVVKALALRMFMARGLGDARDKL